MAEMTDSGTDEATATDEKGQTFIVEVAYALPQEQTLLSLQVKGTDAIRQIIEKSGLLEMYPELDPANLEVGIFGKLANLDQTVREKDRIEIYRPLIADPKEVRKRRAAEGKKLKKGGG